MTPKAFGYKVHRVEHLGQKRIVFSFNWSEDIVSVLTANRLSGLGAKGMDQLRVGFFQKFVDKRPESGHPPMNGGFVTTHIANRPVVYSMAVYRMSGGPYGFRAAVRALQLADEPMLMSMYRAVIGVHLADYGLTGRLPPTWSSYTAVEEIAPNVPDFDRADRLVNCDLDAWAGLEPTDLVNPDDTVVLQEIAATQAEFARRTVKDAVAKCQL